MSASKVFRLCSQARRDIIDRLAVAGGPETSLEPLAEATGLVTPNEGRLAVESQNRFDPSAAALWIAHCVCCPANFAVL